MLHVDINAGNIVFLLAQDTYQKKSLLIWYW